MAENPLIQRQATAQRVVDKYQGKALKYGARDCATLACDVIVSAGYANPMRGVRSYEGKRGAIRALRETLVKFGLECGGLPELLDALGLERIAMASALAGDLIALPGPEPFNAALGVAVGNGKALAFTRLQSGADVGFVGDMHAVASRAKDPATGERVQVLAWRVPPCPL